MTGTSLASTCAERGGRSVTAAVLALAVAGGCAGCGAAASGSPSATVAAARAASAEGSASSSERRPASVAPPRPGPFAVGERVYSFVDRSRRIRLPGGRSEYRPLVTVVRYPAVGSSSSTDVRGAAPARGSGPFGLVVFGHGFAVTPRPYAALLQAWTRAGFVVAAPIFPRENEYAPGGPDEADIVNQPRDMRFLISRLLGLSIGSSSPLAGMIAPARIAVSGQSDGGETAVATAYSAGYRDRRVRAAVILSGAVLPGKHFAFPVRGPPLLATQGTADTINLPENTDRFFAAARRPKFLLMLLGAGHLPPYTTQEPQLGIVERVSIAFLQRYLYGETGATSRLARAGRVAGAATLTARP